MYTVYKHTCPNGKVYIGITSMKPEQRWREGKGYSKHIHFHNAILKYGWDNLKHEILYMDLTKEEACQKEIELIAKYKSNQKEFGYNLSSGGEHYRHSVETCEKLREMMLGKRKGQHLSEITKQKIKENNARYWKGKRLSEETKRKISEAHIGKILSEEHKRKIREGNQKSIFCIETNEIYASVKDAKEKLKLKGTSHIGSCCKGKRKTAYGYHWRYV